MVSGQLHRCCGIDRDVQEMQVINADGLLLHKLKAFRPHEQQLRSSFGRDLSRIWAAGSREMLELMAVPSILDYESGCTMKRASDKGTGGFPTSIVCKSVECCSRKRVVIRTNSEHAIFTLSKAVWQAGVKENSFENAPKHSSASMGAIRSGKDELIDTLIEC